MLIRLFFIHLLVYFISASPTVVIKTGGHSEEGKQEHHNANNHDVIFKKGTSGANSESGYAKGNEHKHAEAQDAGKYSQENADKKQHIDEGNSAAEKFQHEQGGTIADFGNKLAHKKGHHRSGFHNSYHKDESGSNSSYYDDSNNEGGEYVHNSHQGAYGGKSTDSNHKSHLNGHLDSRQDVKHGGYDKGGGYQRASGDNKNYNKDNYYNNQVNHGNVNSGNQHGVSGGYAQEQYHNQHPQYYVQPPYYPKPYYYEKQPYYETPRHYEPVPYDTYAYPEKKTITIYEDPRVYDQTLEYKRYENSPSYEGDSVQLDIRPPPAYDSYAAYDNYYY